MSGETRESVRIHCQMDEWKTCVICGELDRKLQMRCVTNACHLHLLIAYLKFSGTVPLNKSFASYDNSKVFETFICFHHIELPAKALRNIYAFPPEVPLIRGKCNPQGLIRVLKKYLPVVYHNFNIYDLAMAIPDNKVPLTREVRDRTCCQLIHETQRRLKIVLENMEHTASSVNLNFSLFQELVDIEDSLNVQIDEEQSVQPVEMGHNALRECEKFLIDFEKTQMEEHVYQAPPMTVRMDSPLQSLLSAPSAPSDSSHFRKRKQPLILGKQPKTRSFLSLQDTIKAILNCPLVIFSIDELRIQLPSEEPAQLREALTHLESVGLLYSHILSTELVVIHLKEMRLHKLEPLWNFGVIPVHYCQRLIGPQGVAMVREQIQKHGDALMEMEVERGIQEAIETVASACWTVGGVGDIKSRTPKLEMLDSLHQRF